MEAVGNYMIVEETEKTTKITKGWFRAHREAQRRY